LCVGYVCNADNLSAFAADTACQLDVLWHDGDALGVDRAQVGVLEQTDEVSLAGLLESHDCRALEAEIGLEVLSDLANQALERQLADQQLGRLLVTTDLTKSNSSGPVTVGLLHSAGGRCTLPGSLGSKLLPRRLSSCRLACGLLSTCHFDDEQYQKMLLLLYRLWVVRTGALTSCGRCRFVELGLKPLVGRLSQHPSRLLLVVVCTQTVDRLLSSSPSR